MLILVGLKEWARDLNSHVIGIGCPSHILHNSMRHGADTLKVDMENVVLKTFHCKIAALEREHNSIVESYDLLLEVLQALSNRSILPKVKTMLSQL